MFFFKRKKEERVLKDFSVGIAGLGLIGGSLALALGKHKTLNIVACDSDADTLTYAFDTGMIHLGHTEPAILRGCRVIFVCTPVSAVSDTIDRVYGAVEDGAVITDVASVKGAVMARLPEGIRFVGGHPMAGTEKSGVRAAEAELFKGKYWTLVRPPDGRGVFGRIFSRGTVDEDFETVRKLVELTGALPFEADAESHDAVVAAVSHLPHIAAYTLADCALIDELAQKTAAGGFKDMTRIALSDPAFWSGVCRLNRDNILKSLSEYRQKLGEISGLIEGGDFTAVENFFARAREKRSRIE